MNGFTLDPRYSPLGDDDLVKPLDTIGKAGLTPGEGTAQRISTFEDTLAPQMASMQPETQTQYTFTTKPQVMGKVYDSSQPSYTRGTMGEEVGPDIMEYNQPSILSRPIEPMNYGLRAEAPIGEAGSDYEPLPPINTPVQQDTGFSTYTPTPGKKAPASIRYQNPGAMWYAPGWQQKFGATYGQKLNDGLGQGNQIARFPSYEQGAAALMYQLNRPMYSGKTVSDAIRTWSGGNNVPSYLRVLGQAGFQPNQRVSDIMSNPQTAVPFAQAMARHEAGVDYPMSPEQWGQSYNMYQQALNPNFTPAQPQQVGQAPTQTENGFVAALPQIQTQTPGSMQTAQQPTGQPQLVEEQAQTQSKQERESSGFLNTLGEVGGAIAGGVAQGTQNTAGSPMQAALQGGAQFLETLTNQEARESTPLGKLFAKDQGTGKTPIGSFGDTIKNLFGGDSAAENPFVNLGSMSPNASPLNFNNAFANKLVYSDATGPTGDQADNSQPLFERLFGAI